VAHEAPPPASHLNQALPPACDAVFARALAKKREERFLDATSFVAALMAAETGEHLDISPDPLLESLVELASDPPLESEATPPPPGPEALPAPGEPAAAGVAVSTPAPQATLARRRGPLAVATTVAGLAAVAVLAWALRPPPPEPAGPGPLRIETQPLGVPVWIDDRLAGHAPLMLALGPGTHKVRVFQEGFAPAELTLQLAPGTTAAPLRFVMAPLPPAQMARADLPPGVVTTSAAEPETRHAEAAPADGRAAHRDAARANAPFWTPVQAPPAASPAPEPHRAAQAAAAGELRPPRRVAGDIPRYPDDARRLGLSGSVLLDMVVNEKGRPEQVRVLESAGSLLDETVMAAVNAWRFEPAERNGVKVAVHWPYRHTFTSR